MQSCGSASLFLRAEAWVQDFVVLGALCAAPYQVQKALTAQIALVLAAGVVYIRLQASLVSSLEGIPRPLLCG